jgi:PBP1b-binding outer membrane lipoprotein LpoB
VAQPQEQVRQALLDTLINLISEDTYPSNTMMDMVEELLTPDDVERYTEVLLDKVRDEQYPSIPMLARIRDLAGI